MASAGALSISAGCTDRCSCTAKDTGALLTTASFSARRVPVSSGLSIGMLPWATSAGGGSLPSGRRSSSIFNTWVSESELLSGGGARGAGGAGLAERREHLAHVRVFKHLFHAAARGARGGWYGGTRRGRRCARGRRR